ncbi:MAG: hypothetical protein DHS20C13_13640 [Thermodesulfobacteriota bacterium]|nr:MAG: hypothetical protein DHS20C13_13640 [Thermodesulfobacteriota bacterium]
MQALNLSILFLLTILLLQINSYADTDDVQIVRGQLACVQLDKTGNAEVSKEFTECGGLLYLIGVDGNLYSLHGSEEEIEKIKKSSKDRMGYRLPLRLEGKTVGHERAWQMYTPSLDLNDSSIKTTVTGSVLCVFPDYDEDNVKPVIADGACDEYEPHAHFIKTDKGEVYALLGSPETIKTLEKSSQKENVTLDGTLKANKRGWILYVD